MGWHTVPGKFGGKDGLAIPMLREGVAINHKYRGPGKRMMQDPEAPRSLWNEDCLRDPSLAHLPLLITEGEFDGLAAIQAGHVRTVSVIDGAGTNLDFLEGIWPLLEAVPRIILAGDGDAPGQKLNGELARRLGAARCARVEYPEGAKDLNDVVRDHGEAAALERIEKAKPYPIEGIYRLSDFPEQEALDCKPCGWIGLNTHLKLWVPELMVITGIPGHGKSKFALHLLCNQVEDHGAKVAIFSAEVPVKPIIRDELRAYHGGTPEDADAWIEENFVWISSNPRTAEEEVDAEWLIEKAGDAVIRHGITWMLIDPWNQLEHKRTGRESITEYQERQLRAINRFRRSFGVGVVIVAHPTKAVMGRDGKVRTPGLYDIDGSAHWYNAPDHGVVVDRPNIAGSKVRIIVRKSRFRESGVAGEAWLDFDQKGGRYSSAVGKEESVDE